MSSTTPHLFQGTWLPGWGRGLQFSLAGWIAASLHDLFPYDFKCCVLGFLLLIWSSIVLLWALLKAASLRFESLAFFLCFTYVSLFFTLLLDRSYWAKASGWLIPWWWSPLTGPFQYSTQGVIWIVWCVQLVPLPVRLVSPSPAPGLLSCLH